MQLLPLTRGKFTKVDDKDYVYLNQFKWRISDRGYVERTCYIGSKHNIRLHTILLKPVAGKEVDHKDRDKLNNQRDNLRLATRAQQVQNCRKHKNTSSRFKGLCWCKTYNKWRVGIRVDKKLIYLGRFDNEIEGYLRYCQAAKKYFGEFACLK